MSEPAGHTEDIIIETSKLTPHRAGATHYALHARGHLTTAQGIVMDALNGGLIDSNGAKLMTELLNGIDRRILADIAKLADLDLPEGQTLHEAFVISSNPGEGE